MAVLLAYLTLRGREPGPLSKMNDCHFSTKQIFIARVRSVLSVLGYDCSSYAGHSFRIGAATTVAECGIEDSLIKILGRWEGSAYQLYVHSSQQTLKSASKGLVTLVAQHKVQVTSLICITPPLSLSLCNHFICSCSYCLSHNISSTGVGLITWRESFAFEWTGLR